MISLSGLSAFPITPADAGGRVETDALRRLVAPLRDAGVDSIGLLGSTGSYPYLSRHERRRAIETAFDAVNGEVPLLVGIGALRTDEAVALAQDARAIGATAGLLAAVSYTPLMPDEVFEHFVAVAREDGLPLCIYDNPGTTHFAFTPALVGRLSREAGVIAIKSPAPGAAEVGAHLAGLRERVPDGFSLGYSGDWNAAEALLAGGETWYSVMGGLFPRTAMAIVWAVRDGDAVAARALDARLRPLWDLFKEFSSLRVIYACAQERGLCRTQPPRPILPLPDPARETVVNTLRRLDLQ